MADALTIGVLYTCHACGLRDARVMVKAREDEPVLTWMNTMATALSADHRARSPDCTAVAMSYVKIPMTGADRVVGAPVN